MPTHDAAALFDGERDRLFGLAYRMLGTATEAEDVVQDAFVRWTAADGDAVREPAAWLTTVTTRLAIDRLRSAVRQRETYVGEWLPEPLPTDSLAPAALDPSDLAATADSLSFAFLVLLESLSPLERAVLLLHDVFGHSHAEVAAMVERTPAAVRQTASRARARLTTPTTRFPRDAERQHAVTSAFLDACAGGDVERMMALMAPDVVFVGDGGGVATAVPRPVHDPSAIAAMLRDFWRTGLRDGATIEVVEVNAHEPAIWVRAAGATVAVLVIELDAEDQVRAIRGVRNPAKLATFAARMT